MKISIMQPYFFPYIGYYQLLADCDLFIVFDDVQYIRKGWMNRNRVLHNVKEWTYIHLSVRKASQNELIKNIELVNKDVDLERLLGNLTVYKKYAPYYSDVCRLVIDIFSKSENKLVSLNHQTIKCVANYVGLFPDIQISSQVGFDYSKVVKPGDWAFEMSKFLHVSEYINPPGGKDLFDEDKFHNEGIKLTFTKAPDLIYDTWPFKFIPNLSIIDVLMWNPPETIRMYLKKGGLPEK